LTAAAAAASDDQPSTCMHRYWLHAHTPRPGERYGRNTAGGGGKWLIRVSNARVDATWDTIRTETEAGRIGTGAKVSTAKPNRNGTPGDHVICIYTADCLNIQDVQDVLGRIRMAGISGKLFYKEDAATAAGLYARHGVASLYVSDDGTGISQTRATVAQVCDATQ
jgi:hypothetical protein